ncbi:hypothetical protein TIFTF001_032052 [Ficus carica]|uniref:Uncharacterized protein n=1 Tax=Ficus carica TaxID=3494 RepID=A0AA88DW04_FICCA|nr:hypothetical protein TIFTF001_032052 [Ficus carica]
MFTFFCYELYEFPVLDVQEPHGARQTVDVVSQGLERFAKLYATSSNESMSETDKNSSSLSQGGSSSIYRGRPVGSMVMGSIPDNFHQARAMNDDRETRPGLCIHRSRLAIDSMCPTMFEWFDVRICTILIHDGKN